MQKNNLISLLDSVFPFSNSVVRSVTTGILPKNMRDNTRARVARIILWLVRESHNVGAQRRYYPFGMLTAAENTFFQDDLQFLAENGCETEENVYFCTRVIAKGTKYLLE